MTIDTPFDLTGKIALVTGASSGLGRHFAQTLAAAGAKVVVGARRTDRLEALCGDIAAAGGTASSVALDVNDEASIEAAFDAAESAFGTVDVVVNNAGVVVEAPALEQTREQWRKVLDTNLDGVWHVAQTAARRMVAAGRPGAIVNVASILGYSVGKTLSAYSAAKAGVIALTKSLALELADHGIRVNALAPGYVVTELNRDFFESEQGQKLVGRSIPIRRVGDLAELDGPLLLLASDASSFMTGSTIVADGGQLVRGVWR